MTDEQLGQWVRNHAGDIIAGLALAAMHYADPSGVYDALREYNPDADFETWITDNEELRAKIRAQQDGPGIPVEPLA